MKDFQHVNDIQWAQLEPIFPKLTKRSRGKPHTPWRAVVNSILWVVLKGAKWSAIPADPAFAAKSAAHRWFVLWEKNGLLQYLLERFEMTMLVKPEISLPKRRQRKKALVAVEISSPLNNSSTI